MGIILSACGTTKVKVDVAFSVKMWEFQSMLKIFRVLRESNDSSIPRYYQLYYTGSICCLAINLNKFARFIRIDDKRYLYNLY